MTKILLIISFVTSGLLLGGNPVWAQIPDLEVVCNPGTQSSPGSCLTNPTTGAALFNETNLLPGDNITRLLRITNQSSTASCSAVLNATNLTETPTGFLSQFTSSILQSSNPIVGPLNFASLLSTPNLSLGGIPAGSTRDFTWHAHLLSTTGNTYQAAVGQFDFGINVSCQASGGGVIIDGNGEGSVNTITIIKETSSTIIQSNQTSNVTYIIIVSNTGSNSVSGNTVVDLPPAQFSYVPSSWTAFSSRRGNLRTLGITPEPTYSSPGTWSLGELEPGEEVTLTYQASVPSGLTPGYYADLAYAYGYDEDNLVYANQTTSPFVGTQVAIGGPEAVSSSTGSSSSQGQVLGATDTLPATGFHFGLVFLGLVLTGGGGLGLYQTRIRSKL